MRTWLATALLCLFSPSHARSRCLSSDYLAVVQLAHQALSSTKAPYCVIGALALGAWATPRATSDVDFLMLAQCDNPHPFLDLLRARGFAIDQTWHDADPMAREVVLRLIHPSALHFLVDLVFSLGPFDRAALDRHRAVDFHSLTIWIRSPEDLVLMKLRAGRPRDFDDVLGIVKNPHLELDLDYLWNRANRLGLPGELQICGECSRSRPVDTRSHSLFIPSSPSSPPLSPLQWRKWNVAVVLVGRI
ncbi:MAG: nucleotidyltransferase [Nitrospira sp.]|nr:nucleotidyltransferase [Nitrospira sp.]